MLLEMSSGGSPPIADLTGVLPSSGSQSGTLSYDPDAIHSFSLSTGSGADGLTVDFANGNPFFGSGVGAQPFTMDFNGGAGVNTLSFQDSSGSTTPIFNSEDYSAAGPNSGDVAFYDSTPSNTRVYQGGLQFGNLTPTFDSTPVTNYTFTAPSSGGTVDLENSSLTGFARIADSSSSPSFESVDYKNKTTVTIDAAGVGPNNALILDNNQVATGQTALTVMLGSGNDTVDVETNPPGMATAINGGVGSSLVTVDATGLATGSSLSIQGGTGINTLRIDAQGTTATLTTPGTVQFGSSVGGPSFTYGNFSTIEDYETNHSPVLATGAPPTLRAPASLTPSDFLVGSFIDADLIENASSYLATINWGDGSPPTPGSITANPTTPGQYLIWGSHAYSTSGLYSITATVTDQGGSFGSTISSPTLPLVPVTTQLNPLNAVSGVTAVVSVPSNPPPAPTVAGNLSPQSDSGVSNSDGITSVTTPTFLGTATAGATVQVYETPTGSSASPVLIASGVASTAGTWSATVTSPLANGSYQIAAVVSNSGGTSSASLGTVVIDTTAPVITNVVFNRLTGQLDVSYQGGLSGLVLSDLANGANYQVSSTPLTGQARVPRQFVPTSITVLPGAGAGGVVEAVVTLNGGKRLPTGHYTIRVLSSGIEDVAGNHLNGQFSGSFPTGNAQGGGDFAVQITAKTRKVLGPVPFQARSAKPLASAKTARPALRVQSPAKPPAIHVAQASDAQTLSSQRLTNLLDLAIASLADKKSNRNRP